MLTAAPASAPPLWLTGRRLLALWVLVGISLLAAIGSPPITRTQEARVLETAREIVEAPQARTANEQLNAWLIPQLNGVARLRKPPLPYWFSAVAFLVAGVDEGAGRVPTAIIGWLMVGLTFLTADRLLDRRKAFLAAGALATSYLFFRHSRLAETDAPAALFVTAAVYALLRAAEFGRDPPSTPHRPILWHHLAALAMGLAFNAKGLPGLFPLLFLLAYSAVMRRWDVALKFVTSGAIATVLAIGGAWYFYAGATHGLRQFISELREVGTGEDHAKPLYFYVPYLLQATAPWGGMAIVGVAGAAVRWRDDLRLRVVLLWCAAILLPLCVTPNKQFHYLFPLMPPLMLLAGWAIDVACGGKNRFPHRADRVAMVVLVGTVAGIGAVGLAGIPVAAKAIVGTVRPIDWMVGGVLATCISAATVLFFLRGRSAGAAGLAAGLLIGFPLVLGVWYPRLEGRTVRDAAADIRAVSPAGPYCFYGTDMHLPLVFYLRTPVPLAVNGDRLAVQLQRTPSLLLICSEDEKEKPRQPMVRPPSEMDGVRIVPAGTTTEGQRRFELFRTAPTASGMLPSGR